MSSFFPFPEIVSLGKDHSLIPEKTVQEIFETAKIEEVVQDFVNLKRRGVNLIGLCPFHNEKTPSFTVSPSKNIFKCFGCGQGGTPVQFIMEHEHLTYPEALRYLAQKYGIQIEETQPSQEYIQEQQRRDSLYLVNQYARDYYQDQLFNTDRGKSVGLSYFRQRGFREEIIRKFGLGYAPDQGNGFTMKATTEGYNKELLKELGLTTQYDRDFFRSRVIFTIHNLSGKPIAFAGRILEKDVKAPKYINSPETEIYHKSDVLYGAFFAKRAIRKEDECILVEGYTDVISLHQAGIENVVASSGTSLTEGQIRLIKRNTPNVKILYDGDPAGIKAALRGLDLLLEQDLNVKVVLLPEGEDPDSYLQSVGSTAFKTYLEQEAKDFILFKADLLLQDAAHDPVKKAGVIKDIVSSIARVPDPLKRSLYIRECASLVGVEEQLLIDETNKIVTQTFRKKQQEQQRKTDREEIQTREQPAPAPDIEPKTGAGRMTGDEFQEKDIARILIAAGAQHYDAADELTIAEYILSNIEDVIDEFDHDLYQRIARETLNRLLAQKPADRHFFLNHADQEIAKLAVDVLSTPYEYSENWENRWEIFLTTQKMPDENFLKDSDQALKRFKLRKIMRMCAQNQQKIKDLTAAGDHEQIITYLKVQQRLLDMRNELARELGTVVL